MRLLLIKGDLVAVYENKKRLAVFAGAKQFDKESAEQLRLTPTKTLQDTPIEEPESA